MKPRVSDISGENNLAVAFADEETCGTELPIEVVEAYLVEFLVIVRPYQIVPENNERHVDGLDSAEQIGINGSGQDESVDQSVLLKNGRQVDLVGRRLRGIVQGREQHVLLQAAGVGFDA